jgi:hypothetical protein
MSKGSNLGAGPETAMPSVLKRLAQKRVYFGHQSVGANLIQGVRDLTGENPSIRLNIVESSDVRDVPGPVFAHSRLGRNSDPQSKIEGFVRLMEQGAADALDMAFFKFCYVDVTPATDVAALFANYSKALQGLTARYPRTVFVHVTIPLASVQAGPKAWAKRILRMPLCGYDDNRARWQFNECLRKQYGGKEPLFDLARAEATAPNGSRVWLEQDGCRFEAIAQAYTDDGGHLNEVGRRRAAAELLVVLAAQTG